MRTLLGSLLVLGLWCSFCVGADDKKDADKKDAEKSGTVVGILAAKTDNTIDVKADGEEKPRRYVPQWVGDAPAQGGGFDKTMLKTIKELKVGSRIRLEWKYEERPRVVKVEVIKAPPEKDK